MRVKVSSTRIQVFFTDKINQSRGEQYLQILDAPLDLARVKGELQEAGSDEFWIGFTAATGGLNQRHEVAAFSIDRE